MIVYGKNVAMEILTKPEIIKNIILQDNFSEKNIISLIKKLKIKTQIMSKRKMDELAEGIHQGIIIDIKDYQYSNLNEILGLNPNFIVILDHIEDPHNFGAIIRTCEAAGVDAIIISKDRQALVTPTVMKTSAGALLNMKIVKVSNLVRSIEELKKSGFWIVGTDMKGTKYSEIDYTGKIAIIIGNEGTGMGNLVSKSCDFIATIPMLGKVNSLNASVSAGIIIYEVVRNRK